MWRFLGRVISTALGILLFWVIVIWLLSMASNKPKFELSDNSVLKIKLDREIVERETENPFNDFWDESFGNPSKMGLLELKTALKVASKESKIKAVWLEINSLNSGFGIANELREALLEYKTSGKPLVVYSDYMSEGAYFLASVADKIYITPTGLLEFNGFSYEVLFFKGTLDKLDIKPEVFKAGQYKSAVEPLLLDKMSEPNKEQTLSFMNSLQEHIYDKIAASRGLSVQKLKNIADSLSIRNPKDAEKASLITKAGYADELLSVLSENIAIKTSEINWVSYKKVAELSPKSKSKNKIVVIVASGDINTGKGKENESIGSDKVCEQLAKCRADESVKAVVLRINSPGGSVIASDNMWREIMLTKKVKPVVASMSDMAASGGYYMAMPCNKIVAQPTTITGSIGVFGVWFNAKDFLKNKLGVTSDRVKTGKYADLGMPTKDLTPFERQVIQNEVDNTYKDFVSKAASGRNVTFEKIEKHASGRVWTGMQAKEIGLIDELGGLDKAVEIASQLSKTADFELSYLPKKVDFFESFTKKFTGGNDDMEEEMEEKIKAELGELHPYFTYLKKLKKMEGVQAVLPFEIIIK
ncbi:MAG: signal peptide peptidase SppA [Cytophagales bacterium]